jgi:hypothetical protein
VFSVIERDITFYKIAAVQTSTFCTAAVKIAIPVAAGGKLN